MGGTRRYRRNSRLRAIGAGLALLALSGTVAACGESESSDANEAEGTFHVKVVSADFPTDQQLGQTSLMKIGVANTGDKQIPALTVHVSIAGEEGQTSMLPFGVHDPQPGLAQPDRPIWVLAEGFPHLAGSSKPAGAKTSSPKTFDFGSLEPGAKVEGVWKLSAVRAGDYTVRYGIDAGLSGNAKAVTAGGIEPGGTFAVSISTTPPATEVTDSGEIVEIDKGGKGSKSGK